MNAVRSRVVPWGKRLGKPTLWLMPVALLAPAGAVVGADLREAVREILPATVAVEWRAEAGDDPAPSYGSTGQPQPNSTLSGQAGLPIQPSPNPVPAPAIPTRPSPNPTPLTPEARTQALRALGYVSESGSLAGPPDAVSLASGTVVSADGLIVTLLGERGKGDCSVTLHDGRRLSARLVVDDRRSGLKLLQVDQQDLPHVQLADEEAQLGQQVVTAFCRDPKTRVVAQGIVAATDRRIGGLPSELLETDVQVENMSAGAPLADVSGKLLGIVAAKVSLGERQPGPALAIPGAYVRYLLEAREGDSPVVVGRALLGVAIDSSDEGDFPVVKGVTPESAAAAAGIQEGDEIRAIDGQVVKTPDDVVRIVGRHVAGDQITVTIRRDDEPQELKVTLGPRETKPQTAATPPQKIEAARPGSLYIVDAHGRLMFISPDSGTAAALGTLEGYNKALSQALGKLPGTRYSGVYGVPSTIRVQRSDVEKKLDQLNSDVQSLRDQLHTLIEEVKKLREELGDP